MGKRGVIIISAGAQGREYFHLLKGIAEARPKCPWEIKGFLDDRPEILAGRWCDAPILGSVEDYSPAAEDVFLCSIGSPRDRRKYAAAMRAKGGEFININCSRPSVVESGNRFGSGILIGSFCTLSCDISVGDDTCMTSHVTVGHDVVIGQACQVGAYTFIGGGAKIGDGVTLHPHSCISPGAVVEDGATVGAGSVVLKHVPAGETVFGVPAQIVRH